MYFPYFQNFCTKFPLKFKKYMKLLDIFEETISKCPDFIRKNTPLLAHSLDYSLSKELKLLVNHYESPCRNNMCTGGESSNIWLVFTRTGSPLKICRCFPQIVFTLLIRVRPINVGFSNRFFLFIR